MDAYYVVDGNLFRICELKRIYKLELSLFVRPIKAMFKSCFNAHCFIFCCQLLPSLGTFQVGVQADGKPLCNMDRHKLMVPTTPKVVIVKQFQICGCIHALQL